MVQSAGPLVGLTVLDLFRIASGGIVTSMLADFGAEVIKGEHPRGSDPLQSWGPSVAGESNWRKTVSRNKKSMTLDLGRGRGGEMLLALAQAADVLVESFRHGHVRAVESRSWAPPYRQPQTRGAARLRIRTDRTIPPPSRFWNGCRGRSLATSPLRLLPGRAALRDAHAKLDILRRDFDAWAETALSADFPNG